MNRAELLVRDMLAYIGESPKREGLVETPARVVRSWREIYRGYSQDPHKVVKVFEEESTDEMVILKNIEFCSMCEHHMLPFFGHAHVAYLPAKCGLMGASKLARIVDIFARRLQTQERLCTQIADSLMELLTPRGAACMIEAEHFCITSRGVQKRDARMTTSCLRGVFKLEEKPHIRAEFFNLVKD